MAFNPLFSSGVDVLGAAAGRGIPWGQIFKLAGPVLLNLLSGRLGAGAARGRSEDMRRQLERFFTPEAIGNETNKFFNIFQSSPMYTALRSRAMTGSTSLANQINNRAARSGLGNSGLAAVAEPLARSSFQQSFQNIDADLFTKALAAAQQSMGARAGLYRDTYSPPLGGATAGRALESSIPYLYALMKKYWQLPGWEGEDKSGGMYG